MAPLIVALIAACNHQDAPPGAAAECVIEVIAVADDEVIPGIQVTADDVFHTVEGRFAFVAAYDDGASATGGGTVARGAESAFVSLATLTPGTGSSPMETLDCETELFVPVEVQFATDDGRIAFETPGLATPSVTRADGVPDLFHVERDTVSPDGIEAMPLPDETGAEPGLSLQWTPDAFDWVSLWFDGDGLDYQQILEGPAGAP